jgi:hypothetical protein
MPFAPGQRVLLAESLGDVHGKLCAAAGFPLALAVRTLAAFAKDPPETVLVTVKVISFAELGKPSVRLVCRLKLPNPAEALLLFISKEAREQPLAKAIQLKPPTVKLAALTLTSAAPLDPIA